jgi:hypothetical protein
MCRLSKHDVNQKPKGMSLGYIKVHICRLYATRNTVTRLQNVVDGLPASRTTPMPLASKTGPRDRPIDALVIPGVTEALEEDEYPNVPYSHDSVWARHGDRQKDRGKTVSKLGPSRQLPAKQGHKADATMCVL